MGNSSSVTNIVNEAITKNETDEGCDQKCAGSAVIGPVTLNCSGKCCCPSEVDVEASASVSCDCSMDGAMSTLATQLSKADETVKSSFSLATSSSKTDTKNIQKITNIMQEKCGQAAQAKATIGPIDMQLGHNGESCCAPGQKQLVAKFKATSSVQAKCIMSIASKMVSHMTAADKKKIVTDNPVSEIFENIFGDFSSMAMVAGVGLVGVLVVLGLVAAYFHNKAPGLGTARAEASLTAALCPSRTRRAAAGRAAAALVAFAG